VCNYNDYYPFGTAAAADKESITTIEYYCVGQGSPANMAAVVVMAITQAEAAVQMAEPVALAVYQLDACGGRRLITGVEAMPYWCW